MILAGRAQLFNSLGTQKGLQQRIYGSFLQTTKFGKRLVIECYRCIYIYIYMTAKLTPNPSHLFFLQMGHERCLCDRPCRYECITTRACHTKAFCMLLWLFPFGSYTFTHNALKDFWQDSNPKVVVGEGGGPILSLGPHADILS